MRLGDLAAAIGYFERYLEHGQEADDRLDVQAMTDVLAIKLRKKPRPVEISVDPEEALVQCQGNPEEGEGLAPFRRWL